MPWKYRPQPSSEVHGMHRSGCHGHLAGDVSIVGGMLPGPSATNRPDSENPHHSKQKICEQ
eukprot:2344359-Karenia_brevis.AAC.1